MPISKRRPAAPPADVEPGNEDVLHLTIAVPRSAFVYVAPLPQLLSQRNVEQVTGIQPDAYLRILRSKGFNVPVIAEGKLRLVEREPFVEWLKKHRRMPMRAVAPSRRPAVEPLDEVDRVLVECGLTPARPKR